MARASCASSSRASRPAGCTCSTSPKLDEPEARRARSSTSPKLDEPEAPLSPQSQLALIAMMQDMVAQDAQFVVATHSPILLAFPGARIWSFDELPVSEVEYDVLPHVRLTRDFLNAPERYLRQLRRARG